MHLFLDISILQTSTDRCCVHRVMLGECLQSDRPKWGVAQVAPPMAVERAKWDDSEDAALKDMPLEITASHMDGTFHTSYFYYIKSHATILVQ